MALKLWQFLFSSGIQNGYDDALIKRINFFNKFYCVTVLVLLFSSINYFLIGDFLAGLITIGLIFIFTVLYFLNRLKHHKLAISLHFTLVSLVIFYFDSYSGLKSGAYLFYFPLLVGIAFGFDLQKEKRIIAFQSLLIVVLILINVLTNYELFKNLFLTAEKQYKIFLFNLPFSLISLSYFAFIFSQNNLKESLEYQKRIEKRSLSEKATEKSLAEKNILLAELHHRVKNNLAIISALLNLKINDDLHIDAKNTLIESRNRVHSMALIHNQLYKNNNLNNIDFGEYSKELIKEISKSYPGISNTIEINCSINNTFLNIDAALPCALILIELLTNCFKHAFKDRSAGKIDITFTNEKNGFLLKVKDNGIGLPIDFKNKHSLGLSVIEALTGQLNGVSNFIIDNGATYTLNFDSSLISEEIIKTY